MDLSGLVDPYVPNYRYKNYYVSGGYAYTEDHFMVYKLFVHEVTRPSTNIGVRKYFGFFGKIITIRFYPDNNGYHPFVAFVHYENPLVAARVLNFYHKSSIGKSYALYRVLACDSWNQPDCYPTNEILHHRYIPPSMVSIVNLNDDCLDMIVRLLPIKSQLRFARSCSRICQAFRNISKTLYHTLYVDRLINLTKWEMRDFFDFVGNGIIRVKGKLPNRNQRLVIKMMMKFCTNIEELDLDSNVELHSVQNTFSKLFRQQKKLKSLIVSDKIGLSEEDINMLSPTVVNLSVQNVYDLTSKYIPPICQTLRNLESLRICMFLSGHRLVATLPKLKKLIASFYLGDIVDACDSLILNLIEFKSEKLEYLSIESFDCVDDEIAKKIACLRALQVLKCPCSVSLSDNGLYYFSNLRQLEYIDLKCCHEITNKGLLIMILNCKKLKRVKIQGCSLISNILVFELIEKMREQIENKTYLRTGPVLLMASGTAIRQDILYNPVYKKSSHLVIVEVSDNEHFYWSLDL